MSFGDSTYRYFGRRIGTALASAALVVGLSVPSALAQDYRNHDYNQDQDYRDQDYRDRDHDSDRDNTSRRRLTSNDIQRMAMVNGYSSGYEDGITARSQRAGSSYQMHQAYREALAGFTNDWGWSDRRVYQNSFRMGYARGFQDGYNSRNRNRQYERSYVFRSYDPFRAYSGYGYGASMSSFSMGTFNQTAATYGYNDGFERGSYDRQSGRRTPNPQGHGAYETALNGWVDDWGNSAAYQDMYRRYFVQGYDDAFNGRNQNRNIRIP